MRRRIPPRPGFRYVIDMLTAALIAFDSPGAPLRREAVARSLGSLVESCVQGLIADALILAAPGRGLDRIADEAGCALIETPHAADGMAQALKAARRDHILLLLAGFAVERGFAEEAQDFFAYGRFQPRPNASAGSGVVDYTSRAKSGASGRAYRAKERALIRRRRGLGATGAHDAGRRSDDPRPPRLLAVSS